MRELVDQFSEQLARQIAEGRDKFIEPFAMSGAFVNELHLLIYPVRMGTERIGAGFFFTASEDLRMV